MLHPEQHGAAFCSHPSCVAAAQTCAARSGPFSREEASSDIGVPSEAFQASTALLTSLFSIVLSHFKSPTPTRAWTNEAWAKSKGGRELKLCPVGLHSSRPTANMLFTRKAQSVVARMMMS